MHIPTKVKRNNHLWIKWVCIILCVFLVGVGAGFAIWHFVFRKTTKKQRASSEENGDLVTSNQHASVISSPIGTEDARDESDGARDEWSGSREENYYQSRKERDDNDDDDDDNDDNDDGEEEDEEEDEDEGQSQDLGSATPRVIESNGTRDAKRENDERVKELEQERKRIAQLESDAREKSAMPSVIESAMPRESQTKEDEEKGKYNLRREKERLSREAKARKPAERVKQAKVNQGRAKGNADEAIIKRKAQLERDAKKARENDVKQRKDEPAMKFIERKEKEEKIQRKEARGQKEEKDQTGKGKKKGKKGGKR